jgi:hypothetical protein
MESYEIDILVLDLDGTLLTEEISRKMFEEAYYGTLEKLEDAGIVVDPKYRNPTFSNFNELSREIKDYLSYFLVVFERSFNNYRRKIEENERSRAEKIYDYLVSTYKPKEVLILTANSKGKEIIRIILPNIPEDRVIIINGAEYIEDKQKFLKKLKGRKLYVADTEFDEEIAKKSNAEFLNIREIEKQLFESNI